jgi:DNA mismatch repair protein MutL
LLSNLSEFRKLGFNFEHFGGNTFVLREIPTVIEKLPNANIIKEIIADVCEIGKDKSFSEVREQIINYLACHKSIRGGDDLSLKDIRNLLIDLAYCQDPYHCAHGRPTLKFISFKQLDKLFKRVV